MQEIPEKQERPMAKPAKRNQGIARPDFSRYAGHKLDMSEMFVASVATETEVETARKIPIDHLLDNPYQPRIEMQEEALNELAQVIGLQGFQGVLVARPHPHEAGYYQLTAGHRRREAASRAGLQALPVVVRDVSDKEMVTLTITENIQREDLSPLEEGRIYLLMTNEMGYTHEQIAHEVGKKRGYVENRIRVARAPVDVQEMVQAKPDTLVAAYYLAKVEDKSERERIIEQVLAGKLTGEDIPHYIGVQRSTGHGSAMPRQVGDGTGMLSEEVAMGVESRESKQTAVPTSAAPPAPSGLAEHVDHGEAILDGGPSGREESILSSKANAGGPDTTSAERSSPRTRAGNGDGDDRDGSAGVDESTGSNRTVIKVRLAKLAAALSNLRSFENQVAGVKTLSEQELASLAQVLALAGDLYDRFGVSEPER